MGQSNYPNPITLISVPWRVHSVTTHNHTFLRLRSNCATLVLAFELANSNANSQWHNERISQPPLPFLEKTGLEKRFSQM